MSNTYKIICLFLLSCVCKNANANWHQHTFTVMGTQAHVEFWHPSALQSDEAQALVAIVVAEMDRINQLMSPYIETSQLSQVNLLAAQQPVPIKLELYLLIKDAQHIAQLTHGAFDITYASVGYQYNYRESIKPNAQAIAKSLEAINYQSILLKGADHSIHFTHPDIKIDLGGIAKGHAVKQAIALLKQQGIEHALVSAGGDTSMLGDRRGRPWYVGVKHPRSPDKTAVTIPLENESISTSGDYERYFIEDGIRYHHIINPKTGDSAREVISVSIMGKNATYVDALSTAVFIKGLNEGMSLINNLADYEAIIIDNARTMHMSTGLQQN
ncbi:FAD:protein FMN transferase [Shewanella maritima]|uniref:FAD:protein FMN transferase n=1 Tax=Shewanella maritima TaxID=2520507 RepID=UPI003736CE49